MKANKTFNFLEFNEKYKTFKDKNIPDSNFLTWLIGFSEIKGSFVVGERANIYFVINHFYKDIQVLNMIQNNLKFGKVIKQSKTVSSFIVQDAIDLYLIALLFNNNLVIDTNLNSFNLFLERINKYVIYGRFNFPNLNVNFSNIVPTLQDGWLSGFTDAEGYFSIAIYSNSLRYSIILDMPKNGIQNKDLLNHIQSLLKVGKISNHSSLGNYYYRINGLKDTKFLFDYFDNYTLRTQKLKSYFL